MEKPKTILESIRKSIDSLDRLLIEGNELLAQIANDVGVHQEILPREIVESLNAMSNDLYWLEDYECNSPPVVALEDIEKQMKKRS